MNKDFRQPFNSKFLGSVQPGPHAHIWTAEPVAVSLFDDRKLHVRLTQLDEGHVNDIDETLHNFLNLGAEAKELAAADVLADCQAILKMTNSDSVHETTMKNLNNPTDIWNYVANESLWIIRDSEVGEPMIYIVVTCDCDWEPEYGLQLVYRGGHHLTQVSEQDGEVVL